MGYTFFDTAESYTGENQDGSISYNEELVGEALRPHRNALQIATKFGVRREGNELVVDSRPEQIRNSLENSLRRLKMDHVELYYQHRVDPKIPVEEVAGTMADLIREGKILHWGISEADESIIRKAHKVCPLACIQNRYSMTVSYTHLDVYKRQAFQSSLPPGSAGFPYLAERCRNFHKEKKVLLF